MPPPRTGSSLPRRSHAMSRSEVLGIVLLGLVALAVSLGGARAGGCDGTVSHVQGVYVVTDLPWEYVYLESNAILGLQRGGADSLGTADACQSADVEPDTLFAARGPGSPGPTPPGTVPSPGVVGFERGAMGAPTLFNTGGFDCGALSWDGTTASVACDEPTTSAPGGLAWSCWWNAGAASAWPSGANTVTTSCAGLPAASCTADAAAPGGGWCMTPLSFPAVGSFPVTCTATLSNPAASLHWHAICMP